jgi:hypothetical protein
VFHILLPAAAADEGHDFDLRAVSDDGAGVAIAFHDDAIDLDGDDPRIDVELFEQLPDGEGRGKIVWIAVESNAHEKPEKPESSKAGKPPFKLSSFLAL